MRFWITLAVAFTISPALSQTIHRCVLANGSTVFTDSACPDATSGEVIRHESEEARTARQQREQINREIAFQQSQIAAQLTAESAQEELMQRARRDAAIDDSINRARQQESQRQADAQYESTRRTLERIARGGNGVSAQAQRDARAALIDLEEMRAAQASGSPTAVQEATARRDARQAQAQVEEAERKVRAAQAEAQRIQNEARRPKYNPNTGQWCQSTGNVVNCQ